MSHFRLEASFENKGVRGEQIFIFKNEILEQQSVEIDLTRLPAINFQGNKSSCRKTDDSGGFRLHCENSVLVCQEPFWSFPLSTGNDYRQLVLVDYHNRYGSKHDNFFSFSFMRDPTQLVKVKKISQHVFRLNNDVENFHDLDAFQNDVSMIFAGMQNWNQSNSLLFCMVGKLFSGDSLLKRVKVISFRN